MRAIALLLSSFALAGCTQPSQQWDMGPMPPVAALYDRAAPPSTLDERSYYFTRDLAEALSASQSPVDFDYRTWSNDPEVDNQTFGLHEHPPEDRAVVSTRFTTPGVGDGMILSYTLCRRGPSDWKIEDISAEAVPSATSGIAAEEALPSLREMLGLPQRSPSCD